jgi:hypothetical protein
MNLSEINVHTKRQKDAPSPGADLEDMQSLLYLLEEANSHRQYGKPNLALKKYMAIKKVCIFSPPSVSVNDSFICSIGL